jgi:hypothetical protein
MHMFGEILSSMALSGQLVGRECQDTEKKEMDCARG